MKFKIILNNTYQIIEYQSPGFAYFPTSITFQTKSRIRKLGNTKMSILSLLRAFEKNTSFLNIIKSIKLI